MFNTFNLEGIKIVFTDYTGNPNSQIPSMPASFVDEAIELAYQYDNQYKPMLVMSDESLEPLC